MHADEMAHQSDSDEGENEEMVQASKHGGQEGLDEDGVGGPDSAAPPDELPTPGDEGDVDSRANAHAHAHSENASSPRRDVHVHGRLDASRALSPATPAKTEAERQRKEAEEREHARAKAEAERQAKESEERLLAEMHKPDDTSMSQPSRADRGDDSSASREALSRPASGRDSERMAERPGAAVAASPRDAFADRKAALLAEAGSVRRGGEEDDLRRKVRSVGVGRIGLVSLSRSC
jgi:hypothetical protein